MSKWPGFIGPSDRSQSIIADPQQTMNWYLEIIAAVANGPPRLAFYPTPGQSTLLSVADVGARALADMNDHTRAVMGGGIYTVSVGTATATKLSACAQDNNPATIVFNGATGAQVFYTTGTNGYCEQLATNIVTQVLTGTATMGGMLDGYFIAFDTATSRIYLSDLNNGQTWDPTQFAARSAAPDNWKAMYVNAPDIWLIGEQTGDVWYDAGAFPFPFAPRPGANFKFGIAAAFSIAAGDTSVLWLSRNARGAGIVVEARGYTPVPVSTPAVETAIAGYATISDAEAWTYQDQGHTFYVLRFPSANATWVYDLRTGLWHERGTWNSANNRYDAWHPRVYAYAGGKHLVGESGTSSLSLMDVSYGTEADGSVIRRMRIAPPLFNENRQFLIRVLEIWLEMGLGTTTGQGVNPLIVLQFSDDGGKTYGREWARTAGAIGSYRNRAQFWRTGVSRDRVVKMIVTDPIPWRVLDCLVNNDQASAA